MNQPDNFSYWEQAHQELTSIQEQFALLHNKPELSHLINQITKRIIDDYICQPEITEEKSRKLFSAIQTLQEEMHTLHQRETKEYKEKIQQHSEQIESILNEATMTDIPAGAGAQPVAEVAGAGAQEAVAPNAGAGAQPVAEVTFAWRETLPIAAANADEDEEEELETEAEEDEGSETEAEEGKSEETIPEDEDTEEEDSQTEETEGSEPEAESKKPNPETILDPEIQHKVHQARRMLRRALVHGEQKIASSNKQAVDKAFSNYFKALQDAYQNLPEGKQEAWFNEEQDKFNKMKEKVKNRLERMHKHKKENAKGIKKWASKAKSTAVMAAQGLANRPKLRYGLIALGAVSSGGFSLLRLAASMGAMSAIDNAWLTDEKMTRKAEKNREKSMESLHESTKERYEQVDNYINNMLQEYHEMRSGKQKKLWKWGASAAIAGTSVTAGYTFFNEFDDPSHIEVIQSSTDGSDAWAEEPAPAPWVPSEKLSVEIAEWGQDYTENTNKADTFIEAVRDLQTQASNNNVQADWVNMDENKLAQELGGYKPGADEDSLIVQPGDKLTLTKDGDIMLQHNDGNTDKLYTTHNDWVESPPALDDDKFQNTTEVSAEDNDGGDADASAGDTETDATSAADASAGDTEADATSAADASAADASAGDTKAGDAADTPSPLTEDPSKIEKQIHDAHNGIGLGSIANDNMTTVALAKDGATKILRIKTEAYHAYLEYINFHGDPQWINMTHVMNASDIESMNELFESADKFDRDIFGKGIYPYAAAYFNESNIDWSTIIGSNTLEQYPLLGFIHSNTNIINDMCMKPDGFHFDIPKSGFFSLLSTDIQMRIAPDGDLYMWEEQILSRAELSEVDNPQEKAIDAISSALTDQSADIQKIEDFSKELTKTILPENNSSS